MAFTFGFYNSLNGDRRYNAIEMSSIFDGIIKDGIFMSIGTAMMVAAGSGMTVNVGIGRAWFNHTWTLNDAIYPITITQSEVLQDRIDIVALDINSEPNVRTNSIIVVKGTPSTSPVAPALIRSDNHNQYALCEVYVPRGATGLIQGNITNRVGTGSTPFVTGILETMNIDALIAKWESQWTYWTNDKKVEFQDWWQGLRDILDEDVATNLAARIVTLEGGHAELQAMIEEVKKSVGDGKALVAGAITAKGQSTAADATFAQMASNIGQITTQSVLTGNAVPGAVRYPYTFYSNNPLVKQTGSIIDRAGFTLYPGTTAKTGSVTGNYMTGNISVPAVTIAPAYIKKGQVITFPDGSTVTGIFEGYVAGVNDIYNRGTWGSIGGSGFQLVEGALTESSLTQQPGMFQIYAYRPIGIFPKSLINLTGKTKFGVEIKNVTTTSTIFRVMAYTSFEGSISGGKQIDSSIDYPSNSYTRRLLSITSIGSVPGNSDVVTLTGSFSNINAYCYIGLIMGTTGSGNFNLFRMWIE